MAEETPGAFFFTENDPVPEPGLTDEIIHVVEGVALPSAVLTDHGFAEIPVDYTPGHLILGTSNIDQVVLDRDLLEAMLAFIDRGEAVEVMPIPEPGA